MSKQFPPVRDIIPWEIGNFSIRNGIHVTAVFAKKYRPVHGARDALFVFDGAANHTGAIFVGAEDAFVPAGLRETMVFGKRNDGTLRVFHAKRAELRDGCCRGEA